MTMPLDFINPIVVIVFPISVNPRYTGIHIHILVKDFHRPLFVAKCDMSFNPQQRPVLNNQCCAYMGSTSLRLLSANLIRRPSNLVY